MADPKHLGILRASCIDWNNWRQTPYIAIPDLSQADLSQADLKGADLTEANLSHANLSHANLSLANLSHANLSHANLSEADLTEAHLSEANLNGAHLNGANLNRANLNGATLNGASLCRANVIEANLNGATLNGAFLVGAIFANVDLSTVLNLETITHFGPSTIGIDTIYQSKGEIPEVFLRGCGVPDNFVSYAHSLVGKALQFYSCFISYSTRNQDFAERLHTDLQAKGVRCWFSPEDVQSGKKLHEQIDEAIRLHERLLLILSEQSMNSEWVRTEIAKARKREVREGKRVLFPVRLVSFDRIREWECFDSDTGKDSAREIREYFIPDFSTWKDHDAYMKAFKRLLRDLKTDSSSGAIPI